MRVPARAAPDGQRRAPVALARERPVDVVAEPVAEAPVLDVRRVPVDGLVRVEQLLAELRRRDVPRRFRVVEQRRAAAPAVRVGVLVVLDAQQQAACVEVLDQLARQRRVLDEAPGVGLAVAAARALVVGAVRLDGVVESARVVAEEQLGGRGDTVVVLAERRREVHDAGSVLGRDELVEEDRQRAGLAVARGEDRPLVAVVALGELGAVEALDDLGPLAEDGVDARLRQHVALVADAHARVARARRDGDGDVARQRPRRRRPDEQAVVARRATLAADGQLQVDARIDDVLVALRDLVRGERRLAARAVRADLVALVEQAAPLDLRERPPDRLDVALVERAVCAVEVDPEADALGQPVPLLEVREHRLAAARVELADAELLDFGLRFDAELLFDGDLDGQAVAVPAALALDEMPAHRLKARVDVLEHAREHVVGARRPVGRRRSLVEAPARRAGADPQRLGEDVALAPAREHLELELGKLAARVDLAARDQRVSLVSRHRARHSRLVEAPRFPGGGRQRTRGARANSPSRLPLRGSAAPASGGRPSARSMLASTP